MWHTKHNAHHNFIYTHFFEWCNTSNAAACTVVLLMYNIHYCFCVYFVRFFLSFTCFLFIMRLKTILFKQKKKKSRYAFSGCINCFLGLIACIIQQNRFLKQYRNEYNTHFYPSFRITSHPCNWLLYNKTLMIDLMILIRKFYFL